MSSNASNSPQILSAINHPTPPVVAPAAAAALRTVPAAALAALVVAVDDKFLTF
jgi:hypothetical protein